MRWLMDLVSWLHLHLLRMRGMTTDTDTITTNLKGHYFKMDCLLIIIFTFEISKAQGHSSANDANDDVLNQVDVVIFFRL